MKTIGRGGEVTCSKLCQNMNVCCFSNPNAKKASTIFEEKNAKNAISIFASGKITLFFRMFLIFLITLITKTRKEHKQTQKKQFIFHLVVIGGGVTGYLCGKHGLSALRAQSKMSRGSKGLRLEVRAYRAPRLLVNTYCRRV